MSDESTNRDDADVSPVPTRKLVYTVLTMVIPLATYFVVPLDGRVGKVLAVGLVVATVGSLVPLSFQQARLVLRSQHPLFDALRCLVSGFVLLVVSFSSAYYVLGTGYQHQINDLETKLDAVYFTVTIISTVGFGDISASGQTARGIVTLQMIVNFALLGVALRVVSWALKERQGSSIERRLEGNARRLRLPPPR
jgi:voltage-gated potassium channel